jgi:Spy/CpxP family protein refolding chaperone
MLVRLLLAAVIAAGLASAQPGGGMGEGMGGGGGMGRGGSGMGEGMGGGGMMPRRQSRLDQLADKLKLKSDQKSEVERILSAAMEKAGPVRDQLNQARRAVAEAMLNNASDEDVKKALDGYAAVSAQMTGVEADAFGKIYALLKPNQQGKAAQAFELMAGLFSGGGGGGGTGRRGNRGGGE